MSTTNPPEGYGYGSGWIGLPYSMPTIAPIIEVDGEKLAAKPEFHMSILSVKKYAPILAEKRGISLEEAEAEILKESNRLLTEKPVSISEFKDELRIAEELDKKTVVIMCTAGGTEDFFIGMRKALGIEIPTQPFHVTLYTRPNGPGIGLSSAQEVVNQTRLLTGSDLAKIRSAINFDWLQDFTKIND